MLTNAIGVVGALLQEGRTRRHNSWVKGRSVLEKSNHWDCCHDNMASSVSFPSSAPWCLDFTPWSTCFFSFLSNYSDIHNPFCDSTLFLFSSSFASCPLPFGKPPFCLVHRADSFSCTNSLNFCTSPLPPPLVFQIIHVFWFFLFVCFCCFWVNACMNEYVGHYLYLDAGDTHASETGFSLWSSPFLIFPSICPPCTSSVTYPILYHLTPMLCTDWSVLGRLSSPRTNSWIGGGYRTDNAGRVTSQQKSGCCYQKKYERLGRQY